MVRRNIPLTAFLMFLHSTGGKKSNNIIIILIITCQLSSAVIASCLAGESDTSDEVASTRGKSLIPTAPQVCNFYSALSLPSKVNVFGM